MSSAATMRHRGVTAKKRFVRHQLKALAMMVEKESGVLRDVKFTSVWVDESEINSAGPRYVTALPERMIFLLSLQDSSIL